MPDPDLEIRGGGGGGGETGLKNNFFRPCGPHLGIKIGGGGAPLDPTLTTATKWLVA